MICFGNFDIFEFKQAGTYLKFSLQLFPRYEAVSAHKRTLEPQGCTVVEGDAICPLQQMIEKTFERTLEANPDLRPQILQLQEKNGGELPIIFYVNVGTGQVL